MSDARHILGLGDDPDADEDLAAEYADRLTIAGRFLDTAVYVYQGHPTEKNRERLLKAARAYSGAQGDAAFVAGTERRTPTQRERH